MRAGLILKKKKKKKGFYCFLLQSFRDVLKAGRVGAVTAFSGSEFHSFAVAGKKLCL